MPNRWKPNVTVAAIIEQGGRFLLVEEETSDGLRLNCPAGHLDPEESLVQACVREVREETAFAFEAQALVGLYMNRFIRTRSGAEVTYLRVAFCGSVDDFDPLQQLDAGIVRTLWMSLEELRACPERHRSPLMLRSIEDYAAGKRFPLDLIHTDASIFPLQMV